MHREIHSTIGDGAMTAPAPARRPPTAVRTSFLLWVISVVLAVVGIVMLFISAEPLTAGDPMTAVRERAILGFVFFVSVILALVLFCAVRMRAGHNWARIVLTVYGGLSLLPGVKDLGDTIGMLSAGGLAAVVAVGALIGIPLTVAAIVSMYLPTARDWFAPRPPAA
jgi:magnesium-transporting ATPase (P-type)